MSGVECCYILLPDVHEVAFSYQCEGQEGGVLSQESIAALIEKIIVSEADAVSEIRMPSAVMPHLESCGDMRWIEPGRSLFLGRKSPDHVALLSVQLAKP
ncbi:hypothetical protein HW511_04380 [Asaia siamensis]|uniref:Uncharacterized protein n=1 Tax=Asaia siamensis TaxID=110479 RepID=A0ABQ1LIS6_9PROT|nr:hypothetical protein [Asaia siamensis]GGC23312.1 hypothetical protein GCM10007207_05790 [Asaia siamensis]